MASRDIDVHQVIAKFKGGKTGDYDVMVSILSDPQSDEQLIGQILGQLKHAASELGKDMDALISAVLHLKWLHFTNAATRDYMSFIVNLVTSNTLHLRPCIRMIVRHFMPEVTSEMDNSLQEVLPEDANKFLHLHKLLNTIKRLVPLTPKVLMPVLADCFPVIFKPGYIHLCYIENMYHIMDYVPELRTRILELVIDHLAKLDVHSPKHEIEDAEESDQESEDEIFDMETDLTDGQKPDQKMQHVHADKLDILMNRLFHQIHTRCFANDKLDWEATKKLYRELLHVFDRVILPTHASGHVQFFMFYICSFHINLYEGFIDYLWKKVQDPNQQPVFRQAAVSYVASLLARAKYINLSIVKASLEVLTAWVHNYIRQSADSSTQADISHHGPFYSVCQALFYVAIYRHKEFLNVQGGLKFLRDLSFQTIVMCRLNPLRVCLPVIAKTFASVARQHQLAFCDTIMEKNRRMTIPVEGSGAGDSQSSLQANPLDSFFPFDPYILKRSSAYIHPLYQEYYGTPVANDEDEEESNEEQIYSRQESQDLQDTEIFGSSGKTPLSPTMDFLHYSISPGFKST